MKIKQLIIWILAFLPIAITIIVLPVLPHKIPAHYGLDGNVTRYGSKYELLIIPIFTIVLFLLWLLIEKYLHKDKENKSSNEEGIFLISFITIFTFSVLSIVFLYLAYKGAETIKDIDYLKLVAVLLSICWIVIGKALPKLKQNGLVGIRTPWTLASEINWNKTHIMGGKIAFMTGIVSGILCLFVFNGEIGIWISLISSIALLVPITIYSYVLYKKEG